jgi:tRNA G18 (ribose-2'-O)-methylase SpoU
VTPDPCDRLVTIADPDDPRIAAFRAVRERDIAGRHGGFIAEGEVVLRVLARSPLHRARSVLVAATRAAKLAPLLAAFDDEVALYAAPQAVMDQIVGFPIHRGVLAFGERRAEVSAEALLAAIDGPAKLICLFGVSNHDNVGGVFRNAAAFGACGVLLDGLCCDPLYRKAIRVSVGAALSVPFARIGADEDILGQLERHGFTPLAFSPTGAASLSAIEVPRRSAILLGAEGDGLPAALMARTRSVAIPMAKGFDSLNIATASGIALHHLAREGP